MLLGLSVRVPARGSTWGSAREPPAASMQLQPRVAWALAGAALCSFLLLLLHARLLKEGNRDDRPVDVCCLFFVIISWDMEATLKKIQNNNNKYINNNNYFILYFFVVIIFICIIIIIIIIIILIIDLL